VVVVIGGYNSSNTNHLAALCAEKLPTYHIQDAGGVDPAAGSVRHKPVGAAEEVVTRDWLGSGRRTVGVTAGASTPNNKVGETIERIFATRGIALVPALASGAVGSPAGQ
jgi:4-hydroxy-3-methylbut-2-en-1-yl diphosphate reductase